jgi:hypothetical protein
MATANGDSRPKLSTSPARPDSQHPPAPRPTTAARQLAHELAIWNRLLLHSSPAMSFNTFNGRAAHRA